MTGKQLQRWRVNAGISQEELARTVDVVSRTIQRWEASRRLLTPTIQRRVRKAAAKLNAPMP